MYAAVASMMMVGCKNDEVINGVANQEGRLFELNVTQGISSRTSLNGMQTVWNPGDKLYVTSADGTVAGVLTFMEQNDAASGRFEGYVFGGDVSALSHVIFPVPVDGAVNLEQPTGNKLDLPLFGALQNGSNQVTLNNVCALINLPVTGEGDDGTVNLSETGGLLTGSYVYRRGAFEFVPNPEGVVSVGVTNGRALVAAATTDGNGNEVESIGLIVEGSEPIAIPVEAGYVTENNVPQIEIGIDGSVESKILVSTPEELAAAFAKGGSYKLKNDIEVTSTLILEEGKTLNLDLDEHEIISELSGRGIVNFGSLNINNGQINYTYNSDSKPLYNGVAIENRKGLTMVDVDVTSNSICLFSIDIADADFVETLDAYRAEGQSVVANLTGGVFTSTIDLAHQNGYGHTYAVRAYNNSKVVMNSCKVIGEGGIEAACADLELNNTVMSIANCERNDAYGVYALASGIISYDNTCRLGTVYAQVYNSSRDNFYDEYGKMVVNGDEIEEEDVADNAIAVIYKTGTPEVER